MITTKIMLADDHPVVRQGLINLLDSEKGFRVIGETGRGVEVEHLVASLQPDILVLDIMMPDLNGLEITRLVRKKSPKTAVVIFSMYGDEAYVTEALQAGAQAYVLKESNMTELITAIREASNGRLYLCHALPESIAAAYYLKSKPPEQEKPLTARERQVLFLIVQGNTSPQIAERLCLSTRTVEGHRSNMMHKLRIKNNTALIRYALKLSNMPQAD